MDRLRESGEEPTIFEKGMNFWISSRLRFALEMRQARYSLNYAFWRILRIGLPATAVLIAINTIWGFSWYFNTENWASGVWQEITKGRVDEWRAHMTADVEKQALANGIAPDKIFAIEPEGVPDSGDFSFIVIGDTGVLNALRFEDEFVRHKILDAVGDLALLGYPLIGHVVAHRAGHALHTALAARVLEERDAWVLVESPAVSEPAHGLASPAPAASIS